MSIASRVNDLALAAATRDKLILTLLTGNVPNLTALTTTDKTSIVAALNELKALVDGLDGAAINDATTGTATTWSSSKIAGEITAALNALTSGAPAALDTLNELAAAINSDADFSATVTTALGNRVRVDTAAQGLNSTQQGNARTNIGAASAADMGNPETDFVATFNTGLS